MSAAMLFDAYLRAEYVDRNLQWEIRKAMIAAAQDDAEGAWNAVVEYCGDPELALEWLRDNGFVEVDDGPDGIPYERSAMGVRVSCVINGHCYDGCGPYGVTITTLPDGTRYRGEFSCCGWSPVRE